MAIVTTTPLTRTELETLAVMIESGTRKMVKVTDQEGNYVWRNTERADAASEIFAAFYEIQTAGIIATGNWDCVIVDI